MRYLLPALLLSGCASVRPPASLPTAGGAPPPTTVVVRGTAANAGPRDSVRLWYNPQPGRSGRTSVKAPIGAEGKFELKLTGLAQAIDAQLGCGSWFETVFLAPGDSLLLAFDRQQLFETLRFAGRGAYANTYLTRAQRQFDYTPGSWPEEQYHDLPPAEFRQRADARHQQQLDTLAAYHARQPLPDALLRTRRQVLAVQHGTSLLRYVAAQRLATQQEVPLPANYYDFLARLPLRDYYFPTCSSALVDPLAHLLHSYAEVRLLPPSGRLPTAPGTADRLYAQATADFGDTPARDDLLSGVLTRELGSHSETGLQAVQAIWPTFRARTHDSAAVREVRQALRRNTPLQPGNLAPEFRLRDASGQAVSLTDFRGKVVYLDFWYSHCAPCLAEAPAATVLKKQFAGREVVFLYVSIDHDAALWQRTLAKHSLAGPNSVHLLDAEGWQAARPFQVSGYPSYWIIGRDGRIWRGDAPRPSAGAATVAALEQALAE